MADNVTIPATGTGTATPVVATDDVGGVHYQRVKLVDGAAEGTALIGGDATNGLDVDVTRVGGTVAVTDNAGSLTVDAPTNAPLPGIGYLVSLSTDVTRPADTTGYTVNDALSNSTSAPTPGGFTFTGAARISGGSGIITDAIITTAADQGTLLQAEIWLFNASVTNINDNAAFAVTDAEIKTCVGKIPFTLEDAGNNGFANVQNLSIGFTCVGTADLRFLVRVKNSYTPASAEVFTFILKIVQVN